MSPKPPDRHQLAVAILAIATAAIGFGLFSSDVQLISSPDLARAIQWGRLAGIALAIVFYFLVLLTVGEILLKEETSGRELAGPIGWLYLEMASLAWLYVLSLIEESAAG